MRGLIRHPRNHPELCLATNKTPGVQPSHFHHPLTSKLSGVTPPTANEMLGLLGWDLALSPNGTVDLLIALASETGRSLSLLLIAAKSTAAGTKDKWRSYQGPGRLSLCKDSLRDSIFGADTSRVCNEI
jgi:hypothetical protein